MKSKKELRQGHNTIKMASRNMHSAEHKHRWVWEVEEMNEFSRKEGMTLKPRHVLFGCSVLSPNILTTLFFIKKKKDIAKTESFCRWSGPMLGANTVFFFFLTTFFCLFTFILQAHKQKRVKAEISVNIWCTSRFWLLAYKGCEDPEGQTEEGKKKVERMTSKKVLIPRNRANKPRYSSYVCCFLSRFIVLNLAPNLRSLLVTSTNHTGTERESFESQRSKKRKA